MAKSIKVICIADVQTHSDKRRASFKPILDEKKKESEKQEETNVKSIQVIYGTNINTDGEFKIDKDYFIEIS